MEMLLDSMESSHPVEVEVRHPDEIESIFHAISYAKGASILRMIASYIGNDVFFEGMCSYLKIHSYGNTVTNDLWKALEVASGKPVVDFMVP
jgi:aminopeptidase 2